MKIILHIIKINMQRIHIKSLLPDFDPDRTYPGICLMSGKPQGLWYSCYDPSLKETNRTWIDWQGGEEDEIYEFSGQWRINLKEDVIQLDEPANNNRVLLIPTEGDLMRLIDKYGIDKYPEDNPMSRFQETIIDWIKFKRDYAGIEIHPHLDKCHFKIMWYNIWDVACGCIWDLSVIKNVETISLSDSFRY